MDDDPLYELHDRPELSSPVLVVALEGWIDAGAGRAGALELLDAELTASTVATFSGDDLLDFRARRPVLHLRDGVNTALTWPTIELRHARDHGGNDLLLLIGHEPDVQWKRFSEQVVALALELGARMMCGLGAYPIGVPHTRPCRLSVSASSEELAVSTGWDRNSVDVPAGVQSAIERRCADVGLSAVGLWAQVPHYVAAMPYPGASVALLEGLRAVAGVDVPLTAIEQAAEAQRRRIDELVANSDEHRELVHQLEIAYDEAVGAAPLNLANLPSGDELAAELERFLREQGD